MEWGKVKNILIILFAVLNLLLLVNVLNRYINRQAGYESRADIDGILAKRGVSLECALPFETVDKNHIVFEESKEIVLDMAEKLGGEPYVYMTGAESFIYLNDAPSEGFDIGDDDALNASVIELFARKGIDMSGFVVDSILEVADGGEIADQARNGGGKVLKYIYKYQDNLIFDCNIRVSIDAAGGIRSIHVNYRGVKGFSDNVQLRMISAYQIILRNFYEEGQVIKSIDAGYMVQDSIEQDYIEPEEEYSDASSFAETVEGAVWRVMLADGSERYFEGAYGDEIT